LVSVATAAPVADVNATIGGQRGELRGLRHDFEDMTLATRYAILGAGPTGLGVALRLRELGASDFHLHEGASRVGGLAASFTDDRNFTWDIGGHIQFSHYRYFDDLMKRALGDGWLHHQRESWVWIDGRFVPYPFQNNIRHLPPESRWRCLQGLIRLHKQGPNGKPRHFGEWIHRTFGEGIAAIFMVPYNFKVWAHPAEMMDHSWVGDRVAVTDLERVLDNIFHERDDLSWGPNKTFRFPVRGGTGAVWEAVADLVGRERITLSAEAVRIDPDARRIHFGNGDVSEYEVLISTIPIDRLVEIAGLEHLKPHTAKLKFSSTHVVGIGLSGRPPETLKTKCWMYFPESNCPFYRATVFSNYSPNNVPDIGRCWSLMAEVSESQYKPVNGQTVVDEIIQGLRNTNLIDASHEIVSTWHYRAAYGYPIPTLERDEALSAIQPELEKLGIFSRGRFGGWKYEVSNQDHSVMQGVELVNRLLLGVPEVTYWFPNTVNHPAYAGSQGRSG
jgi:protoporphyrinogen oxidase